MGWSLLCWKIHSQLKLWYSAGSIYSLQLKTYALTLHRIFPMPSPGLPGSFCHEPNLRFPRLYFFGKISRRSEVLWKFRHFFPFNLGTLSEKSCFWNLLGWRRCNTGIIALILDTYTHFETPCFPRGPCTSVGNSRYFRQASALSFLSRIQGFVYDHTSNEISFYHHHFYASIQSSRSFAPPLRS